MTTNKGGTVLTLNVKVPKQYNRPDLLRAFGTGLYTLYFERRPEEVPKEDLISVQIKLTEKGASFWEKLLPEYKNNKRRLARHALHVLTLEPKHCLNCRL